MGSDYSREMVRKAPLRISDTSARPELREWAALGGEAAQRASWRRGPEGRSPVLGRNRKPAWGMARAERAGWAQRGGGQGEEVS